MEDVCVRPLIVSRMRTIGKGTELSPVRNIVEVFNFKGDLIADNDPIGNFSIENIVSFFEYHFPKMGYKEKVREYFIELLEQI